MKLLKVFALFLCTSLAAAESLVFETDKLSDLYPYLEEDVLVIFDIDNTLIEPAQTIGSDQWSWNRAKELMAKGVPEEDAFDQTNREWRKIHSLTKVQTMEADTAHIIRDLQEQGYCLMGLTLRAPQNEAMTRRELKDVGINLSHTCVQDETLHFQLEKEALFSEGVLYTSIANKKGFTLNAFLNEIGHRPGKIIFIDDKLSHVKDVEKTALALDIPYIGIRYSAGDKRLASFNPRLAELQWHYLHHILTDEEALNLVPLAAEPAQR